MAQRVDATEVCQIFHTGAQQAFALAPEAVISIDGKALASTVSDCHGQQQDFVGVVSACVQQCDGVLGQVSCQNGQSSEIASVRQLLNQLDVTGVWVTFDALHTQKTVDAIVNAGNDYCIGLKRNQAKLLQQAKPSSNASGQQGLSLV